MVATAGAARAGIGVFNGVPSHQALAISRWRLRKRVGGRCEDPTGEGCGLHWIAPVCPSTGEEVLRCAEIIEAEMLQRGFEPLVRIALANDRTAFVTTLLAFDRGEADETTRAGDCHRELTARLIQEGYPPYRAGINDMDQLDPDNSAYWAVAGVLKSALDPHGVLAPGRYDPHAASEIRAAGSAP
jgi:4-cresol dehydrogenase (hydroxylating) flavoprotein subunit